MAYYLKNINLGCNFLVTMVKDLRPVPNAQNLLMAPISHSKDNDLLSMAFLVVFGLVHGPLSQEASSQN